nr:DNA polymerase III subunit delta [Halorhodospira abdelmalekii]
MIAGEEPLLQREAGDAVRAAARQAGYSAREVLEVETNFDWRRLYDTAATLSLFGERRLLELRMASAKPGSAGSAALQDYCKKPPADTVLLVTCGRLERAARESAWVKALAAAGIFVYCWPLSAGKMPQWVEQRLRAAGLIPEREAVATISDLAEGNLLAADQAIEKLRLLVGKGPVDGPTARQALADSARYGVDDLADAALAGELVRAQRILNGLYAERVAPQLILWALARDIRVAARLAAGAEQAVLTRERIWRWRAERLQRAARRLPLATWRQLLRRCHRVDCAIKGVPPGRPQEELRALVLRLARALG